MGASLSNRIVAAKFVGGVVGATVRGSSRLSALHRGRREQHLYLAERANVRIEKLDVDVELDRISTSKILHIRMAEIADTEPLREHIPQNRRFISCPPHSPWNTKVSSSATRKIGAPPEEISTAFAIVCLPPSDAAHACRASIVGKWISAMR